METNMIIQDKKTSYIFQKQVQKNPVRDYSLVEKDNNANPRMPLGDVLSLSKYMRTNTKRLPQDFMFQLTENEWKSMSSQFVMTYPAN